MKSGTKVSYAVASGTFATRVYGIFLGGDDNFASIGIDSPNSVHPVVAVPPDRVAEVLGDETHEEHENRLRLEAAEAAKAEHAKNPAVQAGIKANAAAAIIIAFLMLTFGANAALNNSQGISQTTYSWWSGGSTNGPATLSWVIVPAHSSVANAQAVVRSIDATTDKLAAHVQSYKVIETAVCSFTNATVSIPIGGNGTNTGTKWDSGSVVIRHLLDDTYEKRTLTTSGGQTNLEVTAATLGAVVPGDIIYKVSTTGAAAFTVSTNGAVANTGLSFVRLTGPGLIVGQPNMPILIEIDGTGANATMNLVTAEYVPGTRTMFGLTSQAEPYEEPKTFVVTTPTFQLERP